ncbi:flagellar assembly protein T N-terminal domain-containing protein [uncultured Aquitalea sp.]|uniref:flagellar assembly protein T N-terminal domain-containing protein n=1 Tax=uncultured Aquitalea sp. TaxID=540272 RepID=UPI0025E38506|nr:flagellar assembly protein T N-terminal domain-containing protein [uncultured Aquitalea sp.]
MTIRTFRYTVAALVAAFVFSPFALAAPVTAEGIAPLDGGQAAARELAIRDALQQAAISQGGEFKSLQMMESGNVAETSTLSAPSLQGKVKVLKEYSADGLYHVQLRIDPSAGAATPQAKPQSAACGMPAGRVLRRKLLTTYFHVVRPAEANDLQELATSVPTDLARRLSAKGGFDVRDAGRLTVLSNSYSSEPAAGWETVHEIGRKEDIQFVVAGRILSTAVTDKALRASLYESNNVSEQGMYYNGPFANLLGGAVKFRPTARQFDMEVWVYDTLTGAVLASRRVSNVAQGKVLSPIKVPFGSAAFWDTDYGRMVNGVLDKAANEVADVVACIPLAAKVVKVDGGKRVYLNVGGLDGIATGDQLLLYKPRSAEVVRSGGGVRELGVPEDLSGSVSVIQVQPNFSIAVVQSARLPVEEGDYVRFMTRK